MGAKYSIKRMKWKFGNMGSIAIQEDNLLVMYYHNVLFPVAGFPPLVFSSGATPNIFSKGPSQEKGLMVGSVPNLRLDGPPQVPTRVCPSMLLDYLCRVGSSAIQHQVRCCSLATLFKPSDLALLVAVLGTTVR